MLRAKSIVSNGGALNQSFAGNKLNLDAFAKVNVQQSSSPNSFNKQPTVVTGHQHSYALSTQRFRENFLDGLFLIESGKCKVINSTLKCYYEAEASQDAITQHVQIPNGLSEEFDGGVHRGEFFGESNLLRRVGLEYFGDVVAEGNGGAFSTTENAEDDCVVCLYISWENFQRIPHYEIKKIVDF